MSYLRQLASIVTGIVIGVLVITLLLGSQPGIAAIKPAAAPVLAAGLAADGECTNARTVSVSGAATVNVTPDRALIKLGVESNGITPDGVLAANMFAIQNVIAAVTRLGVEEKDIATDRYIVYPVYDDYSSLVIKGYRIDNVVAITLRDVSMAGEVTVAALKAGANEVVDVQFYTSELRRYRDQARALAMKAAAEKAQALADAAGAKAGCALTISENTWSYYSGGWWGGRNQALWTQNVVQNAQGSGAQAPDETPLSLGMIAVRAEVSAAFSLR